MFATEHIIRRGQKDKVGTMSVLSMIIDGGHKQERGKKGKGKARIVQREMGIHNRREIVTYNQQKLCWGGG